MAAVDGQLAVIAGGVFSNSTTTITDLATAAAVATKLPLAGGTLTGALNGTSAAFSGTLTLLALADVGNRLMMTDAGGAFVAVSSPANTVMVCNGSASPSFVASLPDARLSANVPLKNVANVFTNTLTATSFIGAGGSLTGLTISQISGGAPLASPALTGTPTAPTAAAATSTTQVATTAFVRGEVAALVNAAPSTLDTLGELPAQLATDESAVNALTVTVGSKLAKASNLSDLANVATARSNLGLATVAATGAAGDLTGTLADARLTSNVPLKNAANTFTGAQTISNTLTCGKITTSGFYQQIQGNTYNSFELVNNGVNANGQRWQFSQRPSFDGNPYGFDFYYSDGSTAGNYVSGFSLRPNPAAGSPIIDMVAFGSFTTTGTGDFGGNTVRVRTSRTPSSATATGNAGEISWDASYVYVCTATNTWKRVAIATW